MKSTLFAVLAACISMLITSGIVAFAIAAPAVAEPAAALVSDEELDEMVSAAIDEQYRKVMAARARE